MSAAILHYSAGFPTKLLHLPRLCRMLEQLGEPSEVARVGRSIWLKWPPIYPGLPIPEYRLTDPWPSETVRREPVRVELEGGQS